MKKLLVFLTLAVTFSVYAWMELDAWPVPDVTHNPNDETDTFAYGLAWKDSLLYVQSWNPDSIWPNPPWYTNLFIYDESGNYQGTQFSSDIDDIDCSGVDWKGDTDHGGVGWYMGARREPKLYLTAENGSSYTSFAGPSYFSRLYGVAHNPDNDILYVSDFMTGFVAWGALDGSGHVTSWTQESVGVTYNALKYVSLGRTQYLLAQYRDANQWNHRLDIFSLSADGIPHDIYIPDVSIDFTTYYYYLGDIDFDGEYLWVLDQNRGGESGLDYVMKLDIPEFTAGVANIQPASFGAIKAQFR